MRIPKVPVRLQRHRAWDPFLCTSSQSRAVHIPCWSALQPWDSQSHHPLWGCPNEGVGVVRLWEALRICGLGSSIPYGPRCTVPLVRTRGKAGSDK